MNDFFVEFLIWTLGVYGASNIIVFSNIFKPVRDFSYTRLPFFGKMFICILCTGFWVGAFSSLLVWSPTGLFMLKSDWSSIYSTTFFDACVGSCICWMYYLLLHTRSEGK